MNFNLSGLYGHIKHCFSFDELCGSINLRKITLGTLAFESTGPCYKYLEIYPAPAEDNILLDMTENVKSIRNSNSEGISFTSHTPGENVICMYSNSTAWFSGAQLRVHLDMQVGEHAIDYASVAQREKLNELQLRIRQLLDQVEQITKLSTLSGGEIPSYQ
ncbi:hypothetical protein GQX74_009664 [Glossina fuscipes]|nr:hypothetical protein GQX74_009664 [Glossina fuscipes]